MIYIRSYCHAVKGYEFYFTFVLSVTVEICAFAAAAAAAGVPTVILYADY
jgi:hypothetical protein